MRLARLPIENSDDSLVDRRLRPYRDAMSGPQARGLKPDALSLIAAYCVVLRNFPSRGAKTNSINQMAFKRGRFRRYRRRSPET